MLPDRQDRRLHPRQPPAAAPGAQCHQRASRSLLLVNRYLLPLNRSVSRSLLTLCGPGSGAHCRNSVVQGRWRYATLDATSKDSPAVGCQDNYLPLPAGWEISPQDSDAIAVTAAHPWGTHLLVYSDGGQRYTLNEDYSSPGQAREWYCCGDGRTALGTSSDGTQYKANACARRILLRAPPSTCTGTDPVPTPPSPPTPTPPSPPQLPPPPPPPSASSCASDSSWRDSDGDRCSHYDDKPEWCGFEDSQARCCACKTSASPPCATPFEDSSCARGVRVARGPQWRWGDQDGGVGGVGTVTGRADESGWCKVTWDQGGSNAYRVGSFSMFDLCRWTPGPSGTPPPTQPQAPSYEMDQAKAKPARCDVSAFETCAALGEHNYIQQCCQGSCAYGYDNCYFCPASGTGGPHCFNLAEERETACLASSNCAASSPAPPPYFERDQAKAKVDEQAEDEKKKKKGVSLSDILVPILVVVILAMAYYLFKHRRAAQEQSRVAHSSKCVDVEQGRSIVECPAGHAMEMLSSGSSWRCDVCKTSQHANPRLRCRRCDYDMCKTCTPSGCCVVPSKLPRPPTCPAPVWGPEVFYHGTSLEAAINIQKVGFDVQLSGSNAGKLSKVSI